MTFEGRIPVIPMLPIISRYTEEWYDALMVHPAFLVLGWANRQHIDPAPYNYFTNLDGAVQFEASQLSLMLYALWSGADKLMLCDLDFPGLTAAALPALHLKFPDLKLYSILHAGSWINKDIFAGDRQKGLFELASILTCEKVFVATRYHKLKIERYFNRNFPNIEVLGGLPFYADKVREWAEDVERTKDVLVVGRPEQSDYSVTDGNGWEYHIEQIPRQHFIRKMAEYKAVIIPKVDETFGFTALEAIAIGTIPFVPNDYAYIETMPTYLRYRSSSELKKMVGRFLHDPQMIRESISEIDLPAYAHIFDRIAEVING